MLNILKELDTHRCLPNNFSPFLYIHVILFMFGKFRLRTITLTLAVLKELASSAIWKVENNGQSRYQ